MTLPLTVTESEIDGNGNGHEPETEEQLGNVLKTLSELKRGNGQVISMSRQELGLLQTILRSATETYREEVFWRMVNFIDQEEALDHVAAFYEAKELGMDTTFNVSYVFALCSVSNKKRGWNNLNGLITDTMQYGQHARANNSKKGNSGSKNPRSPLSVG